MKKSVKPTVLIDVFEKDSKIAKKLMSNNTINCEIKDKHHPLYEKYGVTGDYIIIDKTGELWGIERKAFFDAWSSIKDKRVFGQIAELNEAFNGHAILMIEMPTAFYNSKNLYMMQFPKEMRATPPQVMSAVCGLVSSATMYMPTWITTSQEDSASRIIKFAKSIHKMKIESRGITVTRNGDNNDG